VDADAKLSIYKTNKQTPLVHRRNQVYQAADEISTCGGRPVIFGDVRTSFSQIAGAAILNDNVYIFHERFPYDENMN